MPSKNMKPMLVQFVLGKVENYPIFNIVCYRASQPRHPGYGSNPIPRKITLVTVCTARSNCMSDSG